jgi:hypothetical protein
MKRVSVSLTLVLLLCIVGAAMLTSQASGVKDGVSSAMLNQQPAVEQQTCYTIDTSRLEWLGNYTVIHLPIIMKSYAP